MLAISFFKMFSLVQFMSSFCWCMYEVSEWPESINHRDGEITIIICQ